mmetsp:Transcript_1996/g.6301  ORF Transcript_1996/g.6301 Transcript_1996/m.6301 type:complete len:271 (-) Transcript_1996:462-1274(-)
MIKPERMGDLAGSRRPTVHTHLPEWRSTLTLPASADSVVDTVSCGSCMDSVTLPTNEACCRNLVPTCSSTLSRDAASSKTTRGFTYSGNAGRTVRSMRNSAMTVSPSGGKKDSVLVCSHTLTRTHGCIAMSHTIAGVFSATVNSGSPDSRHLHTNLPRIAGLASEPVGDTVTSIISTRSNLTSLREYWTPPRRHGTDDSCNVDATDEAPDSPDHKRFAIEGGGMKEVRWFMWVRKGRPASHCSSTSCSTVAKCCVITAGVNWTSEPVLVR